MLVRLIGHLPVLTALALASPAAFAQPSSVQPVGGSRPYWPPVYCPPAPCLPPLTPSPAATVPPAISPVPAPETAPPTMPTAPSEPAPAPSFAPETSAPVGGSTFAYGGYIDSAIIRSQIRLRYDAAYDNNRPDRAEFFYAKCGCNPGGRGPAKPETRVDYQDISAYVEIAASNQLSGFIEVPVRFLNPDMNDNTAGLSDITAGLRLGLIANPSQAYTFQLRAFAPTGDDDRGLGTGHASVEPAFLVFQKLTDRLYMLGELRDWIPIGGTDFAGNVLRYGIGTAYNVAPCPERQFIAPVVEFVGWSVLGGKETVFPPGLIEGASGDTIVNAKLGIRAGTFTNSFYVGYGRALTGDVWYKDLLRLEYRRAF